ncbi:YbfB/YjiJ family MFS transporter [Stappia sp. P2PMeth1]|uniref:YbfB/YjiJ family MFS transporter n=1 Tax=Stappia sp. P2PMeth1 TaxID=2003586 RepID=UPI001AD8F1EC|nr:YbfB/YjiJ family MFS transporter [Stappia sp. P2PMeth1]
MPAKPRPASASPVLLAFGGFCALAAAMGIGRFALTPVLPFMSEAIPLSAYEAGLIASSNYLGYLIGALAVMAVDKERIGLGFLLSLAGSVATSALMAIDGGLVWLALVRFLGGIASAGVLVFCSVLVLDRLAAAGRGDLSQLYFSGVGIGIALSAVTVGWLAREGAGWQGLWAACGLVSAVLCTGAATFVVTRAPRGAAAPASSPPPPRAHISPALVRLATAYALFGIGYVVTVTFLTSILRQSETLAPFEAPAWAAVGLAAAGSVWVWGRVSAWIGGAWAFSLACLAEAIGVAASVLFSSMAGMALAAVLLGGTFMGITSLGLIEGRRLAGGDPRKVMALMTACFGTGQMVGPTLAGLIADATGSFYWPSMAAAALLVVAAALVGPLSGPRPARPS